MDGPDKSQLHDASVSATENSPVFGYTSSSLSPIDPLKAMHTNHGFNSPILTAPSSSGVSKSTFDVPNTMAYTPGPLGYGPSNNHFGIHSDYMSRWGHTSVPYVQEDTEKGVFERENNFDCHIEQRNEAATHGLQSLVSESMRLIQDSQDPMALDLVSRFSSNGLHYMHDLPSAEPGSYNSSILNDTIGLNNMGPSLYDSLYYSNMMQNIADLETYNEHLSCLDYGTLWGDLDFDTTGGCRNGIQGIGSHWNGLENNLKDFTETNLSYERQLTLPSTSGHLQISSTSHEPPLISADFERKMAPRNRWMTIEEEALRASHGPKEKRPKLDVGGENETCQRCKCTKTKCLQLYCKCFAAGLYCVGRCSCQGCFNRLNHKEMVCAARKLIEFKNPQAFTPKVIKISDHAAEYRDVPCVSRHKTGCNCKKSSCSKKYCECYQGGVGCSSCCKCVDCRNEFGTKEGNSFTSIEIQSNPKQDLGSALPITTSLPLHRSQPGFEKGKMVVLEREVLDYIDYSSTTGFSSACLKIKRVSPIPPL